MRLMSFLVLICAMVREIVAFSPIKPSTIANIRVSSTHNKGRPQSSSYPTRLHAVDVISEATNLLSMNQPSSFDNSFLLNFADQGQNLAGVFFQASLLPYLIFLYFLSFRGNRVPDLGNYGFQFLLFFVLSTIPSGIISKSIYGCSLADVDWLHGGAEALLTITNILIVIGFRNFSNENRNFFIPNWKEKGLSLLAVAVFAIACATGPGLGVDAHTPFFFGLGNLNEDVVSSLPWVVHSEPSNALSIPTWAIHFSSVFEFLFAMDIIWNFSRSTGNEKWKGMAWAMLPLHASGIAACTYHFFYNPSTLQFLVSTQAGLTLLGNISVAVAAYRLAISNGWTISELNPFPKSNTSPKGILVDSLVATPVLEADAKESDAVLAGKLLVLTLTAAYTTKYGELGLDLPFTPNAFAAIAMVIGIPSVTAYYFYNKAKQQGEEPFQFPSFGGSGDKPGLSMADVKKFGVAGTIAYIVTELMFWAVAFPVASYTLYQSSGHWPDIINDSADRATVVGFIFAGANIARLLVPLRLGAALALAPWIDNTFLTSKVEQNS